MTTALLGALRCVWNDLVKLNLPVTAAAVAAAVVAALDPVGLHLEKHASLLAGALALLGLAVNYVQHVRSQLAAPKRRRRA